MVAQLTTTVRFVVYEPEGTLNVGASTAPELIVWLALAAALAAWSGR